MDEPDKVEIASLQRAMQLVEPKLAAALARHGATSPDQLPAETAARLFQEAFTQTAVEHFPDAQIDALSHGLSALRHPLFTRAFKRVNIEMTKPSDAFAMASGVDAAIVLAGFGLPVAPFDRKQPRILAEPSNNIDDVARTFSKWKSALVGFSPCDIPFYVLITDCVDTMFRQIASRPDLREVKRIFERTGEPRLPSRIPTFQHGIVLLPREPSDTISTIFLNNDNPQQGSVVFYGGWTVGDLREGTPNNGFVPVPLQFLHATLEDPKIPMWIWKPVGTRLTLN